jgi:O-antigen/teichoic acid export membrane protein
MTSTTAAPPPLDNFTTTQRSQIRGSSLLLTGRILALGINCLAQVLIVRYLSTTAYGAWAYGLSVVIACEAFSALSLEQSLARFVPIYFEHRRFSRLIGAVVLSLGLVGALSALFILPFYLLPGPISRLIREPQAQQLLFLLILLVPLDSIDALFEGLLASFNGARAIFARKYLLAPLLKVGAILIVRFASLSVRWLAIAYLIAAAIGLLFYLGTLGRSLRSRGLLQRDVLRHIEIPARELLGFTFPVMTTTIVSVLNHSIAAMMLGYYHDATQVAYYRVIYPIATLNQVVFQAFLVLYTPSAAQLFARGDTQGIRRLYWSNAVWMGTLSFPIFIVTCGFARPLVTLLYGARYQPSAIVLMLIATGYFVSVATGFNAQTLQVFGKIRYITVVNLSAIVVNVAANLFVIPRYGAVGAAAVTLGTIVLQNLLNQAALWLLDIKLPRRRYWRFFAVLAAACAAVMLIHFLAFQSPILAICLSVLVGGVVLLVGLAELDLHETFPEAHRIPILGTLCARKFSVRYFVLKALDAVVTARHGAPTSRREDTRTFLRPRAAHYDRVAAAARILANTWPASADVPSRLLLRLDKLPFVVSEFELAGFGFSSTVFRVKTPAGAYALKIYRDSLGHDLDHAQCVLANLQRQYQLVAAAYNSERELLLPVRFLLLHGPLLGLEVAAGIQPFLAQGYDDLFHDLSDAEIVALAAAHDEFRDDFTAFARHTLDLARNQDFCLDVLGRKNVVVTHCPKPRLAIMDAGGFHLSDLERLHPRRLARLRIYLARIEWLANHCAPVQPDSAGINHAVVEKRIA